MATNLVGGPANPVYLVDANGNTVSPASGGSSSITSPLGRQADAASVSTALSTEDVALLTALLTTTAFQARTPALGAATAANSSPVTLATDGQFVTSVGSLTETAPANDTASSGLNGRLQRIAQNITTLISSVLKVVGNVAIGAAASGNPVLVAGKDTSGNVEYLFTDTTGRQIIVGAAAQGAAPAGNPVLLGVYDGTNIQYLRGETNGQQRITLYNSGGTAVTITSMGDGQVTGNQALASIAYQYVYNGASLDKMRAPALYATVETAANGITAIVTSSVGKKLRLLAYSIDVTADAATAGGADIVITLLDVAAATNMSMSVFVPAAAGAVFGANASTGWRILGGIGKLMAATNTALNVNLSAALTAGKVRVNIAYVEE